MRTVINNFEVFNKEKKKYVEMRITLRVISQFNIGRSGSNINLLISYFFTFAVVHF